MRGLCVSADTHASRYLPRVTLSPAVSRPASASNLARYALAAGNPLDHVEQDGHYVVDVTPDGQEQPLPPPPPPSAAAPAPDPGVLFLAPSRVGPGTLRTEYPVPGGGPNGGIGRVDAAWLYGPKSIQIWEVKPDNSRALAQGRRQLARYEAALVTAQLVPHRGFALFPGLYQFTYHGARVHIRDAERGLEAYTVLNQPPSSQPVPRPVVPVVPVVPVPVGARGGGTYPPGPIGGAGRPELGY